MRWGVQFLKNFLKNLGFLVVIGIVLFFVAPYLMHLDSYLALWR